MAPSPLPPSLDQLQRIAADATRNREALDLAADEAARAAARMAARAKEAAQHEALILKRLAAARSLKQILTERLANRVRQEAEASAA